MKNIVFIVIVVLVAYVTYTCASENSPNSSLSNLQNYQVNTPKMVSSGLPSKEQFETLKAMGVTKVIDLIPEDRTEETNLMQALELNYYNVPVVWENPTLENFEQYILAMQHNNSESGITLTHCRLNYRGAVFTYLYRVTHLKHPEKIAKQDLDAIWEPNEVWLNFIKQVKAKY